jgi:hypothetical protein
MQYKVTAFIPDMGSYTTIAKASHGETVEENALWDINSARRHDGLPELGLKDISHYRRRGNIRFTPID